MGKAQPIATEKVEGEYLVIARRDFHERGESYITCTERSQDRADFLAHWLSLNGWTTEVQQQP